MPEEAKILVKKADGTFVRVTLSELKKLKRNSSSSASAKPTTPWVDGKLQTTTEAKKSEVRTAEPMKPEAIKPVEPAKKEEVKIAPVVPASVVPPKKDEAKPTQVAPTPAAAVVKKEEPKPAVTQPVVKKEEVKPVAVPPQTKNDVPANLPATVKQGEVQKIPETKPEEKKVAVPVPPTVVKAAPKFATEQKPAVVPVPTVGKEDMRSLLEEPAPGGNRNMPLTSETREKQVDAIIQNLSFRPAAGNSSRLRTIIQLFLKDVRGETETREILRRPEIEGGMGLSVAQTEEVINKSKTTQVKAAAEAPSPEPLKPSVPALPKQPKFDPVESARLEKELPLVRPKEPVKYPGADKAVAQPSSTKPISTQKTESSKAAVVAEATKISMNAAVDEPFKIGASSVRTTMQDVKAPPLEVGPVDEIRYFSLVDFRRLSTNPLEAATRLGQKFINLKEESIVLYFEAMEAWTNSPLYHDYLMVVSDSLMKRTPLARVTAGDTKRIQLPEIKALVLMEKQLG